MLRPQISELQNISDEFLTTEESGTSNRQIPFYVFSSSWTVKAQKEACKTADTETPEYHESEHRLPNLQSLSMTPNSKPAIHPH